MNPHAAGQVPAKPEEIELAQKRKELAELESRLAELELQHLNLSLELAEFENLYCSTVGALYAELDEVEALIAEQAARSQPLDSKAAKTAEHARKRADESRKAATDAQTHAPKLPRSDSLKDLYRLIAKRLHPDLSRDDADREIRERLMTEANLAYATGDESKLRAILEEYDSSPDTVIGNDIGAELVRTIRRISLASKRIPQIEEEIKQLRASDTYKLKATVDDGKQKGQEVLGEMAERLKEKIRTRREHLESARKAHV